MGKSVAAALRQMGQMGLGGLFFFSTGTYNPKREFARTRSGTIRIPRRTLKAARHDPAGQELLEYGAEYEKQLEEEGLIHP